MEHIGEFAAYLILAVDAFFVGTLILSTYSPYLNPRINPFASSLGLVSPIFLTINLTFIGFWAFVNYRYALLSAIGFLICIPQIRTYIPFNSTTKTIPEGSIKILSYDVMSFNNLREKDGKSPVLSYPVDSNADIIRLQEYNTATNKKYLTEQDTKKTLKAYPYQSIHQQGEEDVQLTCFSKFLIFSIRPIEHESNYSGSMKYVLNVSNDTLTLINNRLESSKLTKGGRGMCEDMIKDPNARKVKTGLRQLVRKLAETSAIRVSQTDSVAETIAACKYPTIVVCGNFNGGSIPYTHRILTRRLGGAFTQSGEGLGIPYNQNEFYFRIDSILISPSLKVYNCTVDRSIKVSSHYPIWCYISKR